MGRILIGLSSWSDRGLIESGFYPPGVKASDDRLSYYAASFPLAEVDATYHAFPSSRNLAMWIERTPPGFVFDIKAFSLFTQHPTPFGEIPRNVRPEVESALGKKPSVYIHQLPEPVADQLWARMADTARALSSAEKLGVILFQFPPWFHFSDKSLDYLVKCREKLMPYRLAVEFRTPDWLSAQNRERTLGLLRQQGVALVCVDEPQGLKTSVPPLAEVTSEVAVVRFHGRNVENWEKKGVPPDERFDYLYSREELSEWAPRIRQMAERAVEVHVVFKNKFRGYSAVNARQMKELLSQK